MTSHRHQILEKSAITVGYRLNYLVNFFIGPFYAELSQETGMARSEFVVLFCLEHVGPISAQEICEITGRPKNSISQAVTKLVKSGLIVRKADTGDARRAILKPTAAGKSLFQQVIPRFQKRESEMLSVLSEREKEQFEKLIGKLTLRTDNWERLY